MRWSITTIHVFSQHADSLFAGHELIVGVSQIRIGLHINQVHGGSESDAVDLLGGDAIIEVQLCLDLDHALTYVGNALAHLGHLCLPFFYLQGFFASTSFYYCDLRHAALIVVVYYCMGGAVYCLSFCVSRLVFTMVSLAQLSIYFSGVARTKFPDSAVKTNSTGAKSARSNKVIVYRIPRPLASSQ